MKLCFVWVELFFADNNLNRELVATVSHNVPVTKPAVEGWNSHGWVFLTNFNQERRFRDGC